MGKNLIIVESPAKIKTIKKFLGDGYLVEASVGHVRDLPKSTLGVDEDQDFAPDYEIIPGKNKVVSKLRSAAKQADTVYLAPDPDREGEAIAWHVAELIRKSNTDLKRIQFNEITAKAVRDALEHPSELREDLFHSQQARRILDRLVGYKISPLLWKKVKRGLSAGRVQSVALRLIADREKERYAFTPEEYWVFRVSLAGSNPPPFPADLWKVNGKKPAIGSEAEATALETAVRPGPFTVSEVTEKERKRNPKPPYITSTMQQEASTRLGFTAKRTMSVAQRLYEGVELGSQGTTALITYMRTDSVRVSDEARRAAREWILETLGKDYYPDKERYFKTKGGAQDAHEAIRPVDPTLAPEQVKKFLPNEQYRLYKLIWERFMASLMAPARFWDTVVTVESGPALWRARGERLIFPGFLKVMGVSASDDGPATGSGAVTLPVLAAGDVLELQELTKEQKFTQPPARYSEASLVRKLEELGIGRPSTYATIISTLVDREYVRIEEKQFIPTDLGTTVSDLLVEHFKTLMDVGFTAQMEENLDLVAEGRMDWVELLKEFSTEFIPTLETAKKQMAAIKGGMETDIPCPECGKPTVIKFGRNGAFLACTGYPDCSFTSNYSRDEQGKLKIEPKEELPQEEMGTCPECGGTLILKRARTGSRFIACSNYPTCKYTRSFSTGVQCPEPDCDGELVEKSSKRGKVFYACNRFPKCRFAVWDWPVPRECPECDSKILVRKSTKARGEHLACPTKGCGYWEKLPEEDGKE